MPIPVPPHEVPAGPLAVRWIAYELPLLRAGARAGARLQLENAGSATWRSEGAEGLQLAYHWLDPRGNPIVWDGLRTAFPRPVAPGERVELPVALEAPSTAGEYVLALDLVHEFRYWLAELGNVPLEVPVTVFGRLRRRALAVRLVGDPGLVAVTEEALAAQEEPLALVGEATAYLPAGARPARDWSRRILDAHDEGFLAVGGSVEIEGGFLERRRLRRELAPWAPGFGRVPDWELPLLCPSLLVEAALTDVAGVPAVDPARVEGPVLCDGRIRVRLRGGRRVA